MFLLYHLHLDGNTAIFNIPTPFKHSRPDRKYEPKVYNSYPHDDSFVELNSPVLTVATSNLEASW